MNPNAYALWRQEDSRIIGLVNSEHKHIKAYLTEKVLCSGSLTTPVTFIETVFCSITMTSFMETKNFQAFAHF